MADNAPLILREVAMSGGFSVFYNVGGVNEVLQNGRFGFVAKKGDVEELKLLVSEAFDRQQLMQDTSEFSAEVMLNKYLLLLTKS